MFFSLLGRFFFYFFTKNISSKIINILLQFTYFKPCPKSRILDKIRDAHVKTPLRGAPEGFLRTNMPFFFLRHMILKRDLPFDSFRYMLSSHNFFRPSEISTRIENSTIFIIFALFLVFPFSLKLPIVFHSKQISVECEWNQSLNDASSASFDTSITVAFMTASPTLGRLYASSLV